MDIEDENALGLTIRGNWGHFRRLDTTSVKQTYRIIPRTTVAGLLSGIVGLPRDSYYDKFSPQNSAIAIGVNKKTSIYRMSELELTTNKSAMKSIKGVPARRIVSRESTVEDRQRNIYEWIKNPSYQLWVTLEDKEFYNDLKTHLENGTTTYTPTLGKSECLATIDYHGEADITKTNEKTVETAVTSNQVKLDRKIEVERVPGFNKSKENGRGRKLSGMISLAYNTDSDPIKSLNNDGIYNVETPSLNQNVRFI